MATTIHPINPTTVLSEPFVDLIDEIEQATNLSEERRRHWVCSLRQIAKSLDRPAEVIPARWSAIRIAVGQLHHARVGVTAKTLANHKSNVKAALRFYQKARATPAWCTIDPRLGQVSWGPGFHVLERVSSLVRYCSARGIGPALVNNSIFEQYWRYRSETTALAANNTAKRFMVRAWNSCAAAVNDWHLQCLTEPPRKVTELTWEVFPVGLRRDLDEYFAGLAQVHRTLKGSASRRAVRRRSRPVEPLLFSPRHRTRFGEQQHL